jgi:hypothetical protein
MIVLLAGPAMADDRSVLFGAWGTETQCARAPIKPGGTALAEPYEIGSDWLQHGEIWCRLNWFPIEPRGDGLFTGARAQCGEDSIRDYLLRMTLSGGELTLGWGVFRSTGPLARCRGQ